MKSEYKKRQKIRGHITMNGLLYFIFTNTNLLKKSFLLIAISMQYQAILYRKQ